MDKMLQWTLRLGQNVTVDIVNLDVTSRQQRSVRDGRIEGLHVQVSLGRNIWVGLRKEED